jgi:transposase
MRLEPLCPEPATWRIARIASEGDRVVVHLEPIRTTVACPVCATPSRRVHSRYQRRPWDLPWGRWPVQLVVRVRRFFCDAPTCLRRVFVESFPQVLTRYGRQTERWRQILLELAHASGAEKGARLAGWLGYVASPDTLIRRQRQESFVFPTPRILGVDEFALRRGCIYGTLLVDLERRQPIAVLEGRTAEPLIQWLQVHPTIAVLVRDRADAYALAGRVAAPDALQVADRFHLVRNVSDALTTLLHAHRWRQPAITVQPADSPPWRQDQRQVLMRSSAKRHSRRRGSAPSGRRSIRAGASGNPSGTSLGQQGWIAGPCASIWRQRSHRSTQRAVLGRPS